MSNIENLKREVIDASVSNIWRHAVNEWEVTGYFEDATLEQSCICGQEHLRHVYTITNRRNGRVISNIGSVCIKSFEREDLTNRMQCHQETANLIAAAKEMNGLSRVPIKSPYYSRRLLEFFYESDVFTPSAYNGYDAFNDYQFMLDMFNKRSEPSENQMKKIRMLLKNQIKPFLDSKLREEAYR